MRVNDNIEFVSLNKKEEEFASQAKSLFTLKRDKGNNNYSI